MEVTGVVTKEVLQKIVEELVNKNFEILLLPFRFLKPIHS